MGGGGVAWVGGKSPEVGEGGVQKCEDTMFSKRIIHSTFSQTEELYSVCLRFFKMFRK